MQEHRLTTTRRARFYTIGGGGQVTDVWMVAHGFGQLAAPFAAAFERLAAPHRLIAAPEALNRYYLELGPSGTHADARVGATWMTREDRENEIADYVDWLDAVAARVVPPAARVTALRFSQGVATMTRWAALGATPVHRLIAWAGQLPVDVDLDRLAARLAGGALVLVRGNTDRLAPWIREDESLQRLRSAGIPVDSLAFDGGHRLDDATLDRLAAA